MKISLCNMRLTGVDKNYYLAQLQQFADRFDPAQITSVAFGKQDIRGGISITLFDTRDCVPCQMHFESKDMMLGFVRGQNLAASPDGRGNPFYRFQSNQ